MDGLLVTKKCLDGFNIFFVDGIKESISRGCFMLQQDINQVDVFIFYGENQGCSSKRINAINREFIASYVLMIV